MRFKLFNRLVVIRNPIEIFSLPSINTWGITNKTPDNFFVFFADYDTVEYGVVKDDIDFLQKNYDLGTVITRISSLHYSKDNNNDELEVGNYHIIGFSKFTFPEIKELIYLSRCDNHFKKGWRYQSRCWVLRLGEKKDASNGAEIKPQTVLRDIFPSRTNKPIFKALVNLFENVDNINLKKYFNKNQLDDSEEVEFISYQTK